MKPRKPAVKIAGKIFLVVLVILIGYVFVSYSIKAYQNFPSVKYDYVIKAMKNVRTGEYIKKIKIDESRSPIKTYPFQASSFEVYLISGDHYSKIGINQIGKELKAVIDDKLKTEDFRNKLDKVDSSRIYIRIMFPEPYPDWAGGSVKGSWKTAWVQERWTNIESPDWEGVGLYSLE